MRVYITTQVTQRELDLASGEVRHATRTVNRDEGARPDTSLEGLGKLKPAFAIPRRADLSPTGLGSVTAGNSSQTSDGAGALILASESAVKRFGLTPLARFVGFSVAGV